MRRSAKTQESVSAREIETKLELDLDVSELGSPICWTRSALQPGEQRNHFTLNIAQINLIAIATVHRADSPANMGTTPVEISPHLHDSDTLRDASANTLSRVVELQADKLLSTYVKWRAWCYYVKRDDSESHGDPKS
ncbi:Uncharacterized protein DAT39_006688 [Clarias magur]|uniref:Uncharacterized protein n=1 Tax=Clarias magur TaxID=1594786 RepID=A0A8J4U3S4_CLAMG|nr:Uncharacterized protein DAT39_006688 [Clarias magur]